MGGFLVLASGAHWPLTQVACRPSFRALVTPNPAISTPALPSVSILVTFLRLCCVVFPTHSGKELVNGDHVHPM